MTDLSRIPDHAPEPYHPDPLIEEMACCLILAESPLHDPLRCARDMMQSRYSAADVERCLSEAITVAMLLRAGPAR